MNIRRLWWRFKCVVLVGGHRWQGCNMGISDFQVAEPTGEIMTLHLHTITSTCPECGSFKTNYLMGATELCDMHDDVPEAVMES